MIQLPPEAHKYAQEVAKQQERLKIFIAIPNMLTDRSDQRVWWEENTGLTQRLFQWAADQQRYQIQILWPTELRFHDHPRNMVIPIFQKSGMDWLCFIDSDTVPHPNLLELARTGKQVVSGSVFCFIKQQLMASIWKMADCEECRNMKDHADGRPTTDQENYRVVEGRLQRWNPLIHDFEDFTECRCKGTGKDPWTFKSHPGVFDPAKPFFQVDSVGGAALLIHRTVFDKLPWPPFQFLFKQKREIRLTEDHYFCWKCREAGIEIWADHRMISSHYKTMDLCAVNQLMCRAYMRGLKEQEKKQSGLIVVPKIAIGDVRL